MLNYCFLSACARSYWLGMEVVYLLNLYMDTLIITHIHKIQTILKGNSYLLLNRGWIYTDVLRVRLQRG